jgi:hypothetical protein
MSGARLVEGTVRRPVAPHTPFVHELLRYLDEAGFTGAPRVLGVEGGEEVLGFVEGHVPVETARDEVAPIVFSDRGVASAFRLIRAYHDVVAASSLTDGHEVVFHGDLSPWNTVYAPHGAVAFIDWDNARPGPRRADVGYAVWRYLMLGFPDPPPLSDQRRYLGIAADAYGLWDPATLLDHAAEAQQHQRVAFEEGRDRGDPQIGRLIGLGALDIIGGAQRWLAANRSALLDPPAAGGEALR